MKFIVGIKKSFLKKTIIILKINILPDVDKELNYKYVKEIEFGKSDEKLEKLENNLNFKLTSKKAKKKITIFFSSVTYRSLKK